MPVKTFPAVTVAGPQVDPKLCIEPGTANARALGYVDVNELTAQAAEVRADKYSLKAERQLTHPLLLNRIHRVVSER